MLLCIKNWHSNPCKAGYMLRNKIQHWLRPKTRRRASTVSSIIPSLSSWLDLLARFGVFWKIDLPNHQRLWWMVGCSNHSSISNVIPGFRTSKSACTETRSQCDTISNTRFSLLPFDTHTYIRILGRVWSGCGGWVPRWAVRTFLHFRLAVKDISGWLFVKQDAFLTWTVLTYPPGSAHRNVVCDGNEAGNESYIVLYRFPQAIIGENRENMLRYRVICQGDDISRLQFGGSRL